MVVVVVAAAAAFVLMAMWEVSWKFQAGREERVKVSKYIRIEPHLTRKWVETNSSGSLPPILIELTVRDHP